MPKKHFDTKQLAKRIRLHALNMTSTGGSSHIGSILSIADILSVLYGRILRFDSTNPKLKSRDRFILSKGHAGAGVYAVLAEQGFFSKKKLEKHYTNGSKFSGHISHMGIPGVEFSTGSLGHGLGVCSGIAYAAKLDDKKFMVYNLMSDGECDEGSNWEAALFSAHHKLNNLITIIDYNKFQSIKSVSETLELEPFAEKWNSFGWKVIEINGHDHTQITSALSKTHNNKPICIIAHTIKGKGVSFMENNILWHYRSPQGQELRDAIKEVTNA